LNRSLVRARSCYNDTRMFNKFSYSIWLNEFGQYAVGTSSGWSNQPTVSPVSHIPYWGEVFNLFVNVSPPPPHGKNRVSLKHYKI
ncbi:unnamed protein product, partial [Tenebrio molitor]